MKRVTSVRGPLAVRRMTAHWVVLSAAPGDPGASAASGAIPGVPDRAYPGAARRRRVRDHAAGRDQVHDHAAGAGPVNELLLTGGSIDRARLATLVRDTLPGGVTTFRSDVLSALNNGPLQHAAFMLFSLAVVVAALLGLAVMLLEFALGAAEREATLARLATMGLGEGQRARVVALEVLPAVIAAAVAAWACALALPRVLAPDIDLSVFTGSSVTVKLAADVTSFAVPLVGLAVLAAVALGIEIRSGRGRSAASLRIGG